MFLLETVCGDSEYRYEIEWSWTATQWKASSVAIWLASLSELLQRPG